MDTNSPNSDRFLAIAVLHEARFRDVLLLEDTQTGERFAAHRVRPPAGLAPDDLSTRVADCTARLKALSHPRLPVLREFIRGNDCLWWLFDYVEGPPLSEYQDTTASVPGDWIARWLSQMLEILSALHEQGMVAGGLMPADLVIAKDGLRLVDVGYLQGLFPEAMAMARSALRRSMLAPEERHSTLHSMAGDLYSAAAVAYWFVAGQGPGSPEAQAGRRRTPLPQRDVEGRAQSLLMLRPDLPPLCAEVIAGLLQFKPSDRGASAAEAMATLAPALTPASEETIQPRPFVKRWLSAPPPSPPPLEPVPAARPVAPGEPVDGLRWTPRLPTRIFLGTLAAALAGVLLWVRYVETSHPVVAPAVPPAAMRLDRGRVLFCVGTRWRYVQEMRPPGVMIADQSDGATVLTVEGGGSMKLPLRGSSLRLDGLTSTGVTLQVLQGSVEVSTGERPWALEIPAGLVACRPGSVVGVEVAADDATVVSVREGALHLTCGRQRDVPVPAGHRVRIASKTAEAEIQ